MDGVPDMHLVIMLLISPRLDGDERWQTARMDFARLPMNVSLN